MSVGSPEQEPTFIWPKGISAPDPLLPVTLE